MSNKNFLFFVLSILFAVQVSGQAFINDVPPNLCPDEEIYVMEKVGDTVYMGGAFSYIGARKPHIAVLDSATGIGFPINDYPNGTVNAIVEDGHGGWIIGGEFQYVGTQARFNLAQIDSLGNLTSWNPSPNGEVNAFLVQDSILYIGGKFSFFSSGARLYAAAFNLNTLVLLPWNTSLLSTVNGEVKCFEPKGDTIYMGGFFNYPTLGANLIGVNKISGLTSHVNLPRTNNIVYSMHIFNNALYVVGSFSSLSQISPSATFTRNRAGSIDLATNLVRAWNPQLNNLATCVSDDGTDIILGGLFGTVQSVPVGAVAAVDAIAGSATANPINNLKPYGSVWLLERYNTILYIGGKISQYSGGDVNALFAYDVIANSVTSWDPGLGRGVFAMAIKDGRIGVSGEFVTSNAVRRNGLCAFRYSDHQLLPWSTQLRHSEFYAEVFTIDHTDSLLYIGGHFDSINGQPRLSIAALNRFTGQPTTWAPQLLHSTEPLVQAILADQGTIYIGGGFHTVNGQSRGNLAAVDVNGNVHPWNPNANSFVRSILSVGSNIIINGSFSSISSQVRNDIALYDKATLTLSAWDPNPDLSIYNVAVDDHRIYCTGNFTQLSGQPRMGLATYDTSAYPQLLNWGTNVYFDGPISSINTTPGHIFFLGLFNNVANSPRHYFASLDPVTGSLENVTLPCFPSSILTPIYTFDDRIYVSKIIGWPICQGQVYTLAAYRAAANTITGTTFFDNNQNGIQDTLEPVRINQLIELQPNSNYVTSDQNGFYSFLADTGVFSVAPVLDTYYPSSIPALHQPHFSSWQSTDSLNDFGLYAMPGVHDLTITLTPTANARLGSIITYLLTYKNAGTVPESGFLTVVLPQYISYDTSTTAPVYYNLADSVQWSYVNLLPGEQRQIVFKCHIGLQSVVGSTVTYHAQIDSLAQDTTPADNVFNCQQTIIASFDPNYKAVFPEDSIQPLAFNDDLLYTVHFQNTGNDTALNIVILDTLSPYLDIQTFEFLGNSHVCTWTISQRILRVSYPQIMLPDSTTDFDGSQGFFTYKIKPFLPVFEGEVISNTAAIYFDYNDAVITNTTNTIFTSLIITGSSNDQNNSSFAVYPNPAKDQLNVFTKGMGLEAGQYEVFDLAGNLVMKGAFEKNGFIIYTPSIENGIYLLSIRTESGETGNLKFVICR
jgi:uncharacterized repeat protein (TIGR01451 family)